MKQSVQLMLQRKLADTRESCTLGLEIWESTEHYEQHRINKDMVIESVLKEQEIQRSEDTKDPDMIAFVSSAASMWAREKAEANGALSAMYA